VEDQEYDKMKFNLNKISFDPGVYHLIPNLAIIYDHNDRSVTFDVALAKWKAAGSVSLGKKSASKKGKK